MSIRIALAALVLLSTRAFGDTLEVPIHIESTPGVELRPAAGGPTVCAAPCDRTVRVDLATDYVFAGKDVAPSDPLRFLPQVDARWYDVRPGSLSRRDRGEKVLRAAGVVLAAGSTAAVVWGFANSSGNWGELDDAGCQADCKARLAHNHEVSIQMLRIAGATAGVAVGLSVWGIVDLLAGRTQWSAAAPRG
jgi:hypothetical protein